MWLIFSKRFPTHDGFSSWHLGYCCRISSSPAIAADDVDSTISDPHSAFLRHTTQPAMSRRSEASQSRRTLSWLASFDGSKNWSWLLSTIRTTHLCLMKSISTFKIILVDTAILAIVTLLLLIKIIINIIINIDNINNNNVVWWKCNTNSKKATPNKCVIKCLANAYKLKGRRQDRYPPDRQSTNFLEQPHILVSPMIKSQQCHHEQQIS